MQYTIVIAREREKVIYNIEITRTDRSFLCIT